MAPELLSVENIDVKYGDVQVVWDCSLNVRQGEVVALFGGNGAGKTSTLRAISRLVDLAGGRIAFAGQDVGQLQAHELPNLGLIHVPEGRHVFPQMSVRENLELGSYAPRVRKRRQELMKAVFELFPVLKERQTSQAGVLSGGQQQMLAIGRGLMADPKLLMLDEPSLGLAPAIVATLFDTIRKIKDLGVTVLLVEQNVWEALEIADRFYLIASGRIVSSDVPEKLRQDEDFRQVYLGL
ncbi:ABC transporter ATP-binding protein [Pseudorhodoplanes sp.]|uniref:ABC transporter ATP-binding protein n=1 Tax=Pseudorhodoplanes sp. TaxID=1934341 RepID=UPI003D109A90